MSTTIRPEVSKKKEYWLPRHRYYELKHFCLQYPMWKKNLSLLDGFYGRNFDLPIDINIKTSDPTAKCAEAREFYSKRIKLIERVAEETDKTLSDYILKAVTEGLPYEKLNAISTIPCCRDVYYKTYRRFFWLLSVERE